MSCLLTISALYCLATLVLLWTQASDKGPTVSIFQIKNHNHYGAPVDNRFHPQNFRHESEPTTSSAILFGTEDEDELSCTGNYNLHVK